MHIDLCGLRLYPAAMLTVVIVASVFSPVYAAAPLVREFLTTGYYSPLPNQCCYVRGSYEADILFNGRGERGADRTPVYPGMLAAPPRYPFGTRIALEGLGAGTVHDRGSRIVERDDGLHRLDIWMGHGEEGLARALQWGARRVAGSVYAPGSEEIPSESLSISRLPAPLAVLANTPKDPLSLFRDLKKGDKRYAVRLLQQRLTDLGYFRGSLTDLFGPKTQDALRTFQQEYELPGDGSLVDLPTHAALVAVQAVRSRSLKIGLQAGMRGGDIRKVQKLLRLLGFYRGRTDGVFGATLQKAVVAFQMKNKVVPSEASPGAGRIGPMTNVALQSAIRVKDVRSKAGVVLLKIKVREGVKENFPLKDSLAKGDRGKQVRALQELLAGLGFFPAVQVNGNFGNTTLQSVIAYQLKKGIIASASDRHAGNVGPATRQALTLDAARLAWNRVRAEGSGLQ